DWTRFRSKSIWSACILHGIINGSAGAAAMFSSGGHQLVGSAVGPAGMLAIALIGSVVLLLDGTYRSTLVKQSKGLEEPV
ncbi:MAG TPA: hypothetical protein PK760_02755, partial [Flavobacteriales bacterium]|nr:hypothetical protein [Flavobacteriales bacterium]